MTTYLMRVCFFWLINSLVDKDFAAEIQFLFDRFLLCEWRTESLCISRVPPKKTIRFNACIGRSYHHCEWTDSGAVPLEIPALS